MTLASGRSAERGVTLAGRRKAWRDSGRSAEAWRDSGRSAEAWA